jgi:SAM-dependent methyltransferase
MKLLRRIADNSQTNSVATRMRQQRFALFTDLLSSVPRPIRILDVGGTQRFWKTMQFAQEDIEVVILNVTKGDVSLPNFTAVAGDARNMTAFRDHEFDVVFSNSVIEHVGNFANQQQMANEVMRVGKRYFVQTPHRYFPIEPHFLMPYFQFWPLELRIWLLTRFTIGWHKRTPDPAQARAIVEEIHLLTTNQLRVLFLNGTMYRERILGLTKSFVMYGGWR